MRLDEARREDLPAGEVDADSSVAGTIGEALQDILRPLTVAPLPMRLVDTLCDIEEADDWRWVRS
jgi:hypothetical protein